MKRDAVLLVPVFLLGMFVVAEMAHAGPHNQATYLVFLAGLVGLYYQWHRNKQKADERLKAIEQGYDPGLVDKPWTMGRAIVAVGAGVPLGVFGLAWLASIGSPNASGSIWIAAAMIGVTVLICGTFVVTRLPASTFATTLPHHPLANGKPHVSDPDAFDVAGRRG